MPNPSFLNNKGSTSADLELKRDAAAMQHDNEFVDVEEKVVTSTNQMIEGLLQAIESISLASLANPETTPQVVKDAIVALGEKAAILNELVSYSLNFAHFKRGDASDILGILIELLPDDPERMQKLDYKLEEIYAFYQLDPKNLDNSAVCYGISTLQSVIRYRSEPHTETDANYADHAKKISPLLTPALFDVQKDIVELSRIFNNIDDVLGNLYCPQKDLTDCERILANECQAKLKNIRAKVDAIFEADKIPASTIYSDQENIIGYQPGLVKAAKLKNINNYLNWFAPLLEVFDLNLVTYSNVARLRKDVIQNMAVYNQFIDEKTAAVKLCQTSAELQQLKTQIETEKLQYKTAVIDSLTILFPKEGKDLDSYTNTKQFESNFNDDIETLLGSINSRKASIQPYELKVVAMQDGINEFMEDLAKDIESALKKTAFGNRYRNYKKTQLDGEQIVESKLGFLDAVLDDYNKNEMKGSLQKYLKKHPFVHDAIKKYEILANLNVILKDQNRIPSKKVGDFHSEFAKKLPVLISARDERTQKFIKTILVILSSVITLPLLGIGGIVAYNKLSAMGKDNRHVDAITQNLDNLKQARVGSRKLKML